MQPVQTAGRQDSQKVVLDKRLEEIAWAVFLIMIGGLWLMPKGQVPEGTWLIGAGIILLGLNLVRYLYGIKISSFGTILGVLALAGGLGSRYGVDLPLFSIVLIVAGLSIIVRPLFQQRK